MHLTKILTVTFMLASSVSAQETTPTGKSATPAQATPEQHISLMFSATDSSGNPIRGLTKEQVFVYENNQLAPTIAVKDASEMPLDLGIVLLASKKKFDQEQAAAIDLAQRVLRPGTDRAFVVTAGGEKPWPNPSVNWLTDNSAVAEAIRGLDKNAGLPDLFNYKLDTDEASLSRLSIQHYNTTGGFSVFDVIWAMMKTDPKPARRAVVIFRLASAHSPGFGERSGRASEANHDHVIAMAESLGVSFFTIGVEDPLPSVETARDAITHSYAGSVHEGGTGNARAYDQHLARNLELQYSAGRDNVERIANETGGRSWWTIKKNYTDAVAGIAGDLASRYVVIFVPSEGPPVAPSHHLKVQVSQAAHVSAPRAYIAQ
jgi:VWFA-related protein